MADGRKNNGGNKSAGRKRKSDEQASTEILGPLAPDAIEALKKGLKKGEPWAVKIFFEWMYSKPKATVDNNHTFENGFDVIKELYAEET
jgi:hypothetical protein